MFRINIFIMLCVSSLAAAKIEEPKAANDTRQLKQVNDLIKAYEVLLREIVLIISGTKGTRAGRTPLFTRNYKQKFIFKKEHPLLSSTL